VTAVEPAAPARRSASAPPPRLPSLTGLRFLAAFLVFGFHVHIERIVAGTVIPLALLVAEEIGRAS
jgi:peptidoglycan/LPS O-acetylase OafA/YrhL